MKRRRSYVSEIRDLPPGDVGALRRKGERFEGPRKFVSDLANGVTDNRIKSKGLLLQNRKKELTNNTIK